jgi:hypothetical protein
MILLLLWSCVKQISTASSTLTLKMPTWLPVTDVFNGYQNLLDGTLNVVVHEWALYLNTSLENLSF